MPDDHSMSTVVEPRRSWLDPNDPLTQLQQGVRAALNALPGEFGFEHPVSGVAATDLFNLNSFIGAGIELEVVRTLNKLRPIWDRDSQWSTYRFERSNQAFPDVRLVDGAATSDLPVALGIELKGWWMLSKEGVPSLRYEVSPDACAPHDLVCVVPWYLSSAVSGQPEIVEPWVESARFSAQWRDHWWQNIRETKDDRDLVPPPNPVPYPTKADHVSVHPVVDNGGNFGRLPRCHPLMDAFIEQTMRIPILGISTKAWVTFLKIHTEDAVSTDVVIEKLQRQLRARDRKIGPSVAEEIMRHLDDLKNLMS